MAQEETTETVETSVAGTTEGTAATTEQTAAAPAEETVSKAEYENALKKAQQAELRRNQLENQIKDRELKALEESENWKGAYEKLKADADQTQADLTAERAQREAESFRAQVVKEFPNSKVRDAAEKLIAKNSSNLVWTEGATPDEARQQLMDQLNVLAETIGQEPVEGTSTGTTEVHPNNPALDLKGIDPNTLSLAELAELLPKAPQRD